MFNGQKKGINSSYKFIQKLWVLNQKIIEQIKADHPSNSNNDLRKFLLINLLKK